MPDIPQSILDGCSQMLRHAKMVGRALQADDYATAERLLSPVCTLGDCVSCDGYVILESDAPHCPTCARLIREGQKP